MRRPPLLSVAAPPHTHDGSRVSEVYAWQSLLLLPAAAGGVWVWGLGGLRTLLLSVGAAVLCEWLAARARKRDFLADFSIVVQGLMLGMLFHAGTPWWLVLVGAALTVFLGKHFFGGLGSYPFPPALLGYAVLLLSWPGQLDPARRLANVDVPFAPIPPLEAWRAFGAQAADGYPLGGLLLGQQMGGVGSSMVLLLALGGLALMAGRYIPWRTPLAFLGGMALTAGIFHLAAPASYPGPLFHLLSGIAVFAAFFLAADFTCSPVNPWAQVVFGLGAGGLAVVIRTFGEWPDGTVFAVLLVGLAQPLIDKIHPRPLALEVPTR
ncbi:MAG: RnfABCDGE type electron transport complex subunit D [Candidatus Eisenbacteria bacterium]|uniref:RnfABCDGE type electron transport complex subunit D n=1 Tax=Eiseniibacteriota bacterium TaxID=2212470 RepID=A0A938BRV9_UNCEI|nr:RnfABCDGE type electron transport complex subunit D [Candidatus Eisenbacteria bacterium]